MKKEYDYSQIGIRDGMTNSERIVRETMMSLVEQMVKPHINKQGWIEAEGSEIAPYLEEERLAKVIRAILDENVIVRVGKVLSSDEIKSDYLHVGAHTLSNDHAIEFTKEDWASGGGKLEGAIFHAVFDTPHDERVEKGRLVTARDMQRTYLQARRDAFGSSCIQNLLTDPRIQGLRNQSEPVNWIEGPYAVAGAGPDPVSR